MPVSFFLPSSFFFFASVDGEVEVVDDVSVIVVSVGGVVVVVSVAAVSVGGCSRGGADVRSLGIGRVVLPIVSVTTGALLIRGGVRGRVVVMPGVPAGYEGIADAIEPRF